MLLPDMLLKVVKRNLVRLKFQFSECIRVFIHDYWVSAKGLNLWELTRSVLKRNFKDWKPISSANTKKDYSFCVGED